ncbi:hypothetical protein BC828DRAFT_386752 [Blastocladiella britannica]|nr:hypothetical protein BC828DRAFT_386752 [Blastocladiella britannica]
MLMLRRAVLDWSDLRQPVKCPVVLLLLRFFFFATPSSADCTPPMASSPRLAKQTSPCCHLSGSCCCIQHIDACVGGKDKSTVRIASSRPPETAVAATNAAAAGT